MVQGQKMTNYGPNEILNLNTSFERSLSKLSENQKIVEIGSTVLKLWLLKDNPLTSTKGVYREEGMQLTLFSESPNLLLIYF